MIVTQRFLSTIFQEPMSSLNPLHRIDKQIKEIITTHNNKNSEELNQSVLKLFKVSLLSSSDL